MAFECVLYLKEECDGCGLCEERRRLRNLQDEESILEDMGYRCGGGGEDWRGGDPGAQGRGAGRAPVHPAGRHEAGALRVQPAV